MFNNPFESFQDMVASAKEERDQLDRLLTVSTPHERSLLTLTAAALLLFVGWLFTGSAPYMVALDGVLLRAERANNSSTVQVVVWLGADIANQAKVADAIEAGQNAVVETASIERIEGEISAVSLIPLASPMSETDATPIASAKLLITLDRPGAREAILPTAANSEPCRVIVNLGARRPTAFLNI